DPSPLFSAPEYQSVVRLVSVISRAGGGAAASFAQPIHASQSGGGLSRASLRIADICNASSGGIPNLSFKVHETNSPFPMSALATSLYRAGGENDAIRRSRLHFSTSEHWIPTDCFGIMIVSPLFERRIRPARPRHANVTALCYAPRRNPTQCELCLLAVG